MRHNHPGAYAVYDRGGGNKYLAVCTAPDAFRLEKIMLLARMSIGICSFPKSLKQAILSQEAVGAATVSVDAVSTTAQRYFMVASHARAKIPVRIL